MKKLLTLLAIILSLGVANAQTKKPTNKTTDTVTKGPTKEETLKFIKDLYGATNRYYFRLDQTSYLVTPAQLANVELVGDRIKLTFNDQKDQTSASILGQILIENEKLFNENKGLIIGVQDEFKSDLPKLKKAIEHLQQFIEKSPFD